MRKPKKETKQPIRGTSAVREGHMIGWGESNKSEGDVLRNCYKASKRRIRFDQQRSISGPDRHRGVPRFDACLGAVKED
jgi:hypothetical protein